MKYVDIRAQEEEWRKFMGLDFNRAETVTASTGGFKSQTEPEEVQPYDIVADREQMLSLIHI